MVDQAALVIVGNGIAGTTLARQVRKFSGRPITIVSEEHPYFFSRTALMYVYMGHMPFEQLEPYERSFWEGNAITCLQDRVVGFDAEQKQLFLSQGEPLAYSDLVWAVGSQPNRMGWPGERARRVQGLYHKQDLDQLEAWSPEIDQAVIVGGGLIGIELAEMLHSRGKKVTFLVREDSFWNTVLPSEDSALLNQHILNHGIDLRLGTELERIETDADGNAIGVITTAGEAISCQYVGLTVGVRPNIDFLKETALKTDRGLLVNRYLETNLPQVYALGDCAQQQEPLPGRGAVEAVWYTGRMMGETLAQTLCGQPTAYQPGPWFNSAKFFDIEYQTYGQVSAQPNPSHEMQWHWQHPSENRLLRFAYDPTTQHLLGVNSFGMRLRHEVLHHWLQEGIAIEAAVAQFAMAQFDPEFTRNDLPEIQRVFQPQNSH